MLVIFYERSGIGHPYFGNHMLTCCVPFQHHLQCHSQVSIFLTSKPKKSHTKLRFFSATFLFAETPGAVAIDLPHPGHLTLEQCRLIDVPGGHSLLCSRLRMSSFEKFVLGMSCRRVCYLQVWQIVLYSVYI